MAAAKEGGDTGNSASLPYGGGGAGGKFRKKPIRRQTTPYDRPPAAPRVDNDSNSSWLRKLVVEPASRLISYGAERFFAPLLRKRLPPPPSPPSPQPPAAEAEVVDGDKGAVRDSQDGAQESPGDHYNQPVNSSSSNVISELEQLLKQRTFTRAEIVYLRELLQSRAGEESIEDLAQKNEVTATDYAIHQQFASELLEENTNRGNRSALISTPTVNLKVIEDDNASPAELAKAYMGSRPSKVSPSVLGMRSRVGREDTGLFSSLQSASSSPIMTLTNKAPNSIAAPDNSFITPRSRGRSAIYSMARTPYSRLRLTSNLKRAGNNSSGYAGPSMPSSLSPMESNEKFGSRTMSLKRSSSSVFDDEVGSIGPIRRLRQKPNLLPSRIHPTTHIAGIGSHTNQKLSLIGESSHKVSKDGVNENESVPTSSYSRVPSKSSEVASKILQHLEKMTPKEKSPESKIVSRKDKLSLTQNVLSGQALKSVDDVGSSKMLLDVQDDHKFGDTSNVTLVDGRDLSTQKQKTENDPKNYATLLDKNDSVVSLKASTSNAGATDFIRKAGASASQPPNKRAFRMSAQEDTFEQDDDAHRNKLAPRPFSETKGTTEASLTGSKVAPPAEPMLEKPSIGVADKSPFAPITRKTSEVKSSAVTFGGVGNVVSTPLSEETRPASQLPVFPPPVAAFDKPKEANNPPLFSFSPAAVGKVASSPSESAKEAELKTENSSSVFNVSASSGSQFGIPESDKSSSHLNNLFKAGDTSGQFASFSSVSSNGQPPISSPPLPSFPAASNDADQVTKGSASQFPSLISSGNFAPSSTSAGSNGSIFGLKPNPSNSAAPGFKFGSPVDPSSSVSAASTTSILADKKSEIGPSSGSSSSSLSNVSPFSAASSGSSSSFGFGSTFSFSGTHNNQGSSLFANPSKPLVSGVGIGSESESSLPALNVTNSTSLASTSSSQGFNTSSPFSFGLSTSTSSTISAPPFKFGASSTEGTAVSSNSGSSPATFSFGFGSNSNTCSTNAVGSTTTSSLFETSGFKFGGSSPSPSSISTAPNTSSLFGSSLQSSKPSTPTFGSSGFTSPSPSTGFAFGATASSGFNNPSSSASVFSFTSSSVSQPAFGNPSPDQMNAEDSMAEDKVVQPSTPVFPVFGQHGQQGQQPASGFGFGSTSVASQPNPFMFGGQQNQPSSPFQASGSLENFSGGGSFSLGSGGGDKSGSGGGDKSGRKVVKINRSKNRRK